MRRILPIQFLHLHIIFLKKLILAPTGIETQYDELETTDIVKSHLMSSHAEIYVECYAVNVEFRGFKVRPRAPLQ